MFDAIAHNDHYFTAAQTQENAEKAVAAGADATQEAKHEESTQKTRLLSEQEETRADSQKKDTVELSQEAQEISQLKARDQEVRAHEQAHAAAGGSYAGAPSYQYKRGADGKSYAVDGEVSIDVSAVSGDPQATLQKAQQVKAAALAPAEPSAQDMKVAQRAEAMAAKARGELSKQASGSAADEAAEAPAATPDRHGPIAEPSTAEPATPSAKNQDASNMAHLSYYA